MYDKLIDKLNPIYDLTTKEPWYTRYDSYFDKLQHIMAKMYKLTLNEVRGDFWDFPEEISNFVHDCFIDFFITTSYKNYDDNIITKYINRFKHRLSRDTLEYLKQVRIRTFSVYKVLEKNPDGYDILQDILLGTEPIKVESVHNEYDNKNISTVLAKIIPYNGKNYFSGLPIKIYEERFKKKFKVTINKLKKLNLTRYEDITDEMFIKIQEIVQPEELKMFALAFQNVYDLFIEKLDEEYDYDFNDCQIIKYPIKNKKKVIKTLNSMEKDGMLNKTDNEFIFRWQYTLADDTHAGIDIIDNMLVCVTTSQELAKDINFLLQKKLQGAIGFAVFETINNGLEPDRDFTQQEENEILCIFFDKHLRETLKDKIPYLNNMTPKQCQKKNPDLFYEWINMIIQNAKDNTNNTYDYSWIIEELSLDKNRLLD